MLPKKNRTGKKQIDEIFKKGKLIGSDNLTFRFISTNNSTIPRISFIVPKTISKKAVNRNFLRRRGYDVLKKYFNKLPAGFVGAFVFGKKSMEIFGGRKNKNKSPTKNLEREIKMILEKL